MNRHSDGRLVQAPVASANVERHLSGLDTTELAAATGTGAASPAVPTDEDGAAGTEERALPQWGPHYIEQRPRRAIESRRIQVAAAAGAVVLVLTGWALLPANTAMVQTTTPYGPPLPDGSTVLPATPEPSSNPSPETTPSASRRPTTAPPPGAKATSKGPTSATTNAGTARLALAPNTSRSLQSVSQSDGYVVQVDNLANVVQVTASSGAQTKLAATFTVVPGLADANCFSFTANGRYLRHSGSRLQLDPNDSGQAFRDDATFCARTGSASGSVCLESKNSPNRYIHQRGSELWLDVKGLLQDAATFRAESSFYPVASWI